MKIKRRQIYIYAVTLIFIFYIGAIMVRYFKSDYKDIQFDKIYESKVELDSYSDQLVWFTLRDKCFDGFFDISMLERLGVDYSNMKIDYNNDTYVVTIGYELVNLSYSYSDMKNRKLGIIPKQFIGKVELKDEFKEMIYIYKIKRLDIDCDYHDRRKNVSFIEA